MERPLSLTSRGVELPEVLKQVIEARAKRLERFYPRLIGCSVVVEGPGARHRNGGPYAVALDLRVPGADPLLVTRRKEPSLEAAIDAAFDAARRQLEELAALQRREAERRQLAQ